MKGNRFLVHITISHSYCVELRCILYCQIFTDAALRFLQNETFFFTTYFTTYLFVSKIMLSRIYICGKKSAFGNYGGVLT